MENEGEGRCGDTIQEAKEVEVENEQEVTKKEVEKEEME